MVTSKKWASLIALIVIVSMVLAACGPTPEPEIQTVVETVIVEQTRIVEVEGEIQTIVETVIETVEVEVEKEVQVEVEVTPVPEAVDRKGGWLDMVVYVEEPSDEKAITRLDAGEMDIYAYDIANPDIYQTVQGMDNIEYTFSYGSYRELTMNPAEVEGKLNPFSNQKIREAMHWLVDRDYIVEEIYGGLARQRYTAFNTVFPDYAKLASVAREIELKYAPDRDKAHEIITAEMEGMGAELVDGKWMFNGEPVEISFIIRTEDKRREIGDYVALMLEEEGFVVERLYKTGTESAVLWQQSDPYEGLWHIYTAGWGASYINRDLAGNFEFFFTPRGYTLPLWQTYAPSETLDTCADRLNRSDFTSLEEREALMAECLPASMEDAVRVFLIDESSFVPRLVGTEVTSDLAAAVATARMNPYTMRYTDQVGGAMTVGMPSILTQPWNPIGGSNWVYDAAVQNSTSDYGMMVDPFTGFRYPQRIERAEVFLQEGLPAGRGGDSEDWLAVEYVPEIVVPDDVWVDFDPINEVFVTAAEKFTETLTAAQKTVIYYPPELYATTWHDGSNFSIGDIVMHMIMYFEPGNPDSAIFDSSQEGPLNAFLQAFKGVKIISEDPLVIETYTDNYALESELIDQISMATWYPSESDIFPYGIGAWHSIGLGVRPEAAGELAFTTAKSTQLETDRTNYIGGPSLDIMASHLISATAESWVPYETTLGQFVSADEAAQRWENYSEWFRKRGHFWIGTGPYYLEGVFPVEGTVIAKSYPHYIDSADRWAGFTTPMIAEVEVDGPGRVTPGEEAAYDVFVTFQGEPYASDAIDSVGYLVLDATGALAFTGEAEASGDGTFVVTLSADQTSGLVPGANRLEVVVVSKAVAIPSSASFDFVTQ
jgi:peptide/nickel transport system substrate-binding protein